MRYQRQPPPLEYDPKYVGEELNKLEQAFGEQDFIRLVELNVAPVRPRSGLVVFADGTNWNPGSGQGAYIYYAGVWNKLG